MPRINRLKPLAVDKAKTPGRYADGGGLYLIVKLARRLPRSAQQQPPLDPAAPAKRRRPRFASQFVRFAARDGMAR
jgi:hypothetical protein